MTRYFRGPMDYRNYIKRATLCKLLYRPLTALYIRYLVFLHTISSSIPEANNNIKNSFQLVKKLKSVQLEENYVLISLGVISLFTNIPIELAISSISNKLEHITYTYA